MLIFGRRSQFLYSKPIYKNSNSHSTNLSHILSRLIPNPTTIWHHTIWWSTRWYEDELWIIWRLKPTKHEHREDVYKTFAACSKRENRFHVEIDHMSDGSPYSSCIWHWRRALLLCWLNAVPDRNIYQVLREGEGFQNLRWSKIRKSLMKNIYFL